MVPAVNNVCVIGAGSSGLVSIKSCLEDGMNPTCYELAADIGGEWNREERIRVKKGPTMYKSLTTNISRVNQGYSDFPYPKLNFVIHVGFDPWCQGGRNDLKERSTGNAGYEWPPFLPWSKVIEYLNMYVDQFELRSYITFNTKVTRVFKSTTYEETGKWMVEAVNLLDDEKSIKEFDAVIAATGKLSKSVYPNIPGLKEYFKGEYMHSSDYVGYEGFENKSVLVIGASSSGSDVACDCSKVASKVILSARSGVWITPRLFTAGLPLDVAFMNRFKSNMLDYLPSFVTNKVAIKFVRQLKSQFDYEATGLEPKLLPNNPLSTRAINDELPVKLYSGRVLPRAGVTQVTQSNKVQFSDGQEDEVDVIVAATGYEASYPYLPQEIFTNEADAKLYQFIFPYEMKHPSTLTIVGWYPHGGGAACTQVEMQARYVTSVLSGKNRLPQKSVMEQRLKRTTENMTINGKFVFKELLFRYQEQLAKEMGLVPSFLKLLVTDPRLAFKLYFGPIIPAHYRIIGEHRWSKAREHCLTENSLSGIKTKRS